MVDTIFPVNAVTGAPSYSGRMLRQVNAIPFAMGNVSRMFGALSGVRPGTWNGTVSATSTTWSCNPFSGVIDAEAAIEAGAYLFAFDGVATGAAAPANASYPRTDIVYVQVDDPAESDGTAVPAVTRKYLAGTAGAGAPVPATPARSMVVARINVPVSGGGSPSVSWVAPETLAAGVPELRLSVATFSALPIAGNWDGRTVYVTDQKTLFMYTADGWVNDDVRVSSLAGVGSPPAGKRLITKAGVWAGAQFAGGTSPQVFNGAFPTKCAVVLLTMQGGPHTSVAVFSTTLTASGLTLAAPASYTGAADVHYVAYGW